MELRWLDGKLQYRKELCSLGEPGDGTNMKIASGWKEVPSVESKKEESLATKLTDEFHTRSFCWSEIAEFCEKHFIKKESK